MGKPKGEPRAAWIATETSEQKRKRAALIRRRLRKEYPDARCALNFSNPLEILVATVLSAQCTDVKVNEVTATLFKKYTKPEDYLEAKPGELEQDIRQTGFFNQKAKSLRGLAAKLLQDFGGEVPRTMKEILTLPGVARKTGNVVLGNAYGVVEGIAVDTHVHRLSYRLGFSDEDDPVKVEQDLMELIPRKDWFPTTYLLIEHGRRVCFARNPQCSSCVLRELCPAARGLGTNRKR
ncbi:MAG: endonuclease III [Actinomycetota bacterium]